MLLEYVPPDIDHEHVQELLAADADTYGRPSLFARALANNPDVLEARQEYAATLVEEGTLDTRTAELAYAAVAAVNDCEYCVASHTERLVEHVGLDREIVDALLGGDLDELDRDERAVVSVARAIADDPKRVSEDDLDRLRAVGFGDAAIVELVAIASAAVAANVIADTLNVLPQDADELAEYAREDR